MKKSKFSNDYFIEALRDFKRLNNKEVKYYMAKLAKYLQKQVARKALDEKHTSIKSLQLFELAALAMVMEEYDKEKDINHGEL
jgi:hypothetical protein